MADNYSIVAFCGDGKCSRTDAYHGMTFAEVYRVSGAWRGAVVADPPLWRVFDLHQVKLVDGEPVCMFEHLFTIKSKAIAFAVWSLR